MSKRGGRPEKYTAERVAIILETLRCGATYETAARAAGISPNTLANWRANKPSFAAEVERAAAEGAVYALRVIKDAMPQDWRAAAWLLEHRYPEEYGRQALDMRASGEVRIVIVDESSDRDIDIDADPRND